MEEKRYHEKGQRSNCIDGAREKAVRRNKWTLVTCVFSIFYIGNVRLVYMVLKVICHLIYGYLSFGCLLNTRVFSLSLHSEFLNSYLKRMVENKFASSIFSSTSVVSVSSLAPNAAVIPWRISLSLHPYFLLPRLFQPFSY
ncbi:hypothetical protein GQ55_9G529500 [Panicum hallii var. hallii]|uniref:Transmembrane protein n=1 Tax=Panicum hallii var. hallii TaxID=1504633 RepID=A0A2T7CEH4_9POAL|nr:hypothetical protein GQ55_9G529500 [Panicum hallii var. hallii]